MRMRNSMWIGLTTVAILGTLAVVFRPYLSLAAEFIQQKAGRKYTVDDRLTQYGAIVDTRLRPLFEAAGVPYPPPALSMVGLKREKRLELYAKRPDGETAFITSYPILAASGGPGPKMREGDYQVPEGLYRICALNPNSLYHLSLRVNYPNAEDQRRGAADGRTQLGSDIMIHGNRLSAGCLAMGDPAAEDLFILAARTGLENIDLLLTPIDMRRLNAPPRPPSGAPAWTPELWQQLFLKLKSYPLPPSTKG